MKLVLTLTISLLSWACFSQGDLPFGKVTWADLDLKTYQKDTSASAVVLNEIGSAYISSADNNLVFERYLKIKILKRRGFDQANFSVALHKQENTRESLVSLEASTYNVVNGYITEIKLDPKKVFTENINKYTDRSKFTLPDIREGSVIEVKYKLTSPYIFTFRSWQFQSDIPKVRSKYIALIPGNFLYNITKRGYLTITDKSSIVKDCYQPGAMSADCAQYEFSMEDVPAFVEEDYMTARSNFASAIYFELSEVRHFDGSIDKKTKEWKDADQELRQHDDFGGQLRKARNVLEDEIKPIVRAEPDELKKAKAIYDFIKGAYVWNGNYGMLAELGVKKAFETRKGNDADINLSLVGALQAVGMTSFPVILSTRENGLPIDIHPVITDFNYVVASVEISGTLYLLDATDRHQPFGLLPLKCINGKGRLMAKESSWIELKARDRQRTVFHANVTQTEEGYEGTFKVSYQGYDALNKRTEIAAAGEQSKYIDQLRNKWKEIEITRYQVKNLDSLENPLEETITVEMKVPQPGAGTIFFDPFISQRWESNPFKSNERLYPVDFGAPREEILILNLHPLSSYEVDELPTPAAMTLPQGGGRYLFNVSKVGNEISITSSLTINRSIYNATEYHYLKELFDRMVQIQHSQIVLKKK